MKFFVTILFLLSLNSLKAQSIADSQKVVIVANTHSLIRAALKANKITLLSPPAPKKSISMIYSRPQNSYNPFAHFKGKETWELIGSWTETIVGLFGYSK